MARCLHHLAVTIGVAIFGNASLPSLTEAAEQARLGLPVDCRLGQDCFVQQMPDVDPGPGTLDPLCGQATYEGHSGWDIRLRSLSDIAQDVPVIAAADGTISRIRDGVPDRIFDAAHDAPKMGGRECGNGVVIDHQGALSSQYCHLKNGSLTVRPGMNVRRGERIGSIGSSGLAEFPHVHLSVRLDGKPVEPVTGRPLADKAHGCGDLSGSLFDTGARQALAQSPVAILEVGLANAPPELSNLVRTGGPPLAAAQTNSAVAWVWAINVDEGARFRIRLVGPGEVTLIDQTTNALPRRKADYLVYVGRKVEVGAGTYHLTAEIFNGEKGLGSKARSFSISE